MARATILLGGVLSGVLCATVIALAVRSFWVKDKHEYITTDGRLFMAISKGGRLDLIYNPSFPGDPGWTYVPADPSSLGGTDYGRRVLGFGWGLTSGSGRYANVPYWFLAAACGAPAALCARRVYRWRVAEAGRCRACGYDCRATPDRCPECGAPSPAAPPGHIPV